MEYVSCDLCGSSDHDLRYRLQDYNYGLPGVFTIVQCRGCGLAFLNPRPSKSEIAAFYPDSRYHPYKPIHNADAAVPGPTHWRRALWLTRKKHAGAVLDVGCGNGLFLLAMHGFGWQCVGVEPNEAAARHARDTLGIEVYSAYVFAIDRVSTFDVITLWDVLEHVHSPYDVLAHCNHLLKMDGIVALHVPNWASIERRLFGERWTALDTPRHLYHFSPQTIRLLLECTGLRVETLYTDAPVLTLASNMLRWAGDRLYRKGRSKALTAERSGRPGGSARRQQLISLVHLLMRPPNALANMLSLGASMTVMARKDCHNELS